MSQQWQLQQIAAIQYAAAVQLQAQQMIQLHAPVLPPLGSPLSGALMESSDEEDEDSEEQRTLFCANLDERVTEELLYEVFLQAGPVQSARIPKDNIGKQRTFGFVTFVHRCSPPYAMELMQGLSLFHRTIVIKFKGSANLPAQRRSLPADCETYKRNRGSYDNSSSQRNSSYPSYYDTSMNDSGGSSALQNPFKQNASDWTLGSSGSSGRNGKERISKHASTSARSQNRLQPYGRAETSRNGRKSHERERDRKQQYHDGGSRRSEQRSSQRR